jgi:hypothetical protein
MSEPAKNPFDSDDTVASLRVSEISTLIEASARHTIIETDVETQGVDEPTLVRGRSSEQ